MRIPQPEQRALHYFWATASGGRLLPGRGPACRARCCLCHASRRASLRCSDCGSTIVLKGPLPAEPANVIGIAHRPGSPWMVHKKYMIRARRLQAGGEQNMCDQRREWVRSPGYPGLRSTRFLGQARAPANTPLTECPSYRTPHAHGLAKSLREICHRFPWRLIFNMPGPAVLSCKAVCGRQIVSSASQVAVAPVVKARRVRVRIGMLGR